MITVFEKKCNEGDGASCLLAGWWFSDGKNVPINDEKALMFFEKGANLNDFESFCNLGRIYERGRGIKQDYDKAKLYYQKACNEGWKCGCEGLHELQAIAPVFENKTLERCGASTIEYTHSDTKMVFVDRIGSLVFSGFRDYGDSKFGVSMAYNTRGIASTIFIYNLDVENISDKPFSSEVADQFCQACNDTRRLHDDANTLSMDIVDLGGKYIIHESMEFSEDGMQKNSHIFVWGYNNNFIKIRFTYEADNEKRALEVLNDLLSYISQYVSEDILTFDQEL